MRNHRDEYDKWKRQGEAEDIPQAFLNAMRFNALQRGMKWRDTYKLTAQVTHK